MCFGGIPCYCLGNPANKNEGREGKEFFKVRRRLSAERIAPTTIAAVSDLQLRWRIIETLSAAHKRSAHMQARVCATYFAYLCMYLLFPGTVSYLYCCAG